MFWRGVLGYLPVNVAQGLVGLFSIVVFTRLLTPEQYGAYALGFSAMSLAHTAVFVWSEAAMARFHARAAEQGNLADHFATLYRLWFGLALIFPLAAGLLVWLLPLNGPIKAAVGAGLAVIVFRSLAKLAQERRRAAGDVRGAALMDVTQTVGGFAIGVVLVLTGAGGAGPLLGLGAIAAVCLTWALRPELKAASGGHYDRKLARVYAGYGLPVALSLILALVIASTDRFLLAGFLGEKAVGVYHAGYTLANRTLDVIFIWLGMAGGPAMVLALERGGLKALQDAAKEQASLMLLLALPAAAGLALTARPLAEIMIGPALSQAAGEVTPWIAVAALFGGLTTYYLHQAFTLGRRTTLLFAAMIAPAAANLILNLILIPRFGIAGAMWATAASYVIGAVASYTLGRRAMPLPIPWETLGRVGLATLLMSIVVARLPSPGGLPELILKAGLGALVYAAAVITLDAGGVRTRGSALVRILRPGTAS
ncbi:MAG: polysaccharide biosynthesis protein [Caulobacter sp.]|nr:polysaccharide biosynthesis protein [Caulobacter sp.]